MQQTSICFIVSGSVDGDLPVQLNPSADCSKREAGAALREILQNDLYLTIVFFFFLADINKYVKQSHIVKRVFLYDSEVQLM